MGDFYSDLGRHFDEAEGSSGFSGDPLPSGWYYLQIEKVLEAKLSNNGVPQTNLQLLVQEGECENQRAFVWMSLGAKETNDDGSNRSKAEIEKAGKNVVNMMKGFLKAINVTTGQPVGPFPENVFNFYNTNAWEGASFIGKIQFQPARGNYNAKNNLRAYHSVDDPKKGLAWLRQQQQGNKTSSAQPQTV